MSHSASATIVHNETRGHASIRRLLAVDLMGVASETIPCLVTRSSASVCMTSHRILPTNHPSDMKLSQVNDISSLRRTLQGGQLIVISYGVMPNVLHMSDMRSIIAASSVYSARARYWQHTRERLTKLGYDTIAKVT